MRKPAIMVAVVAALLVGACREPAPEPAPLSSPTVAAVDGPVKLQVHLGAGQRLGQGVSAAGGCPALDTRIDFGQGRSVRLVAFGTGCEPRAGDNERPGNGNHGMFRSTGDIPASRGPATVTTPLGVAAVFNQPYYECTNSCRDYLEPVAVITLAEPADPGVTSLTVYSERGTIDLNGLTGVIRDRLTP